MVNTTHRQSLLTELAKLRVKLSALNYEVAELKAENEKLRSQLVGGNNATQG